MVPNQERILLKLRLFKLKRLRKKYHDLWVRKLEKD